MTKCRPARLLTASHSTSISQICRSSRRSLHLINPRRISPPLVKRLPICVVMMRPPMRCAARLVHWESPQSVRHCSRCVLARASAALFGRNAVAHDDVCLAARLVLAPRATIIPVEPEAQGDQDSAPDQPQSDAQANGDERDETNDPPAASAAAGRYCAGGSARCHSGRTARKAERC